MRGAITLSGEVLDVQHKSGTSKSGQPYSFHVVSVLTGKSVSEVTWREGGDLGDAPKEGERVNVLVTLDTYAGRLQIEAKRHAPSGARAASPAA